MVNKNAPLPIRKRIPRFQPVYWRIVWLLITIPMLAIYIGVYPIRFIELQEAFSTTSGDLPANTLTFYWAIFDVTVTVGFIIVAIALVWLKPAEAFIFYVSLGLVALGITIPLSARPFTINNPSLLFSFRVIQSFSFIYSFTIFYLFPDGKFVPGWIRVPFVTIVIWSATWPFYPEAFTNIYKWPPVFTSFVLLGLLVLSISAQVHRYIRISSVTQRLQTKWMIYGLLLRTPGLFLLNLPFLLFAEFGSRGTADLVYLIVAIPLSAVTILAGPFTIAISILRHRLWDIDLLLNRTLVYTTLTALVAGLYIAVVSGLGLLFQSQGNFLFSILATVLVAVLFQPLRDWLQRTVNRLMYGHRDEPYTVLSQLGQRLETTLTPNAVLPTLVETIAQTLKLPYVSIELKQAETFRVRAEYSGQGVSEQRREGEINLLKIPLTFQSEVIGRLCVGRRAQDEAFTSNEERLLNDIARQAGMAAHVIQLMADLQRSREQLVTAREEERRRLRRDLHDGLGPQLASQTLTLAAARQLVRLDPQAAEDLLVAASQHAQSAIADIRRVVSDLRPPVLDDLGLLDAIRSQTEQYTVSQVKFTLQLPDSLPALPAAVEVACYRIAQEALTNVIKHAAAPHCTLTLTITTDLCLTIEDDGQGLAADRRSGVGLTSMRERTEELGGRLALDSVLGRGVKIKASLPLSNRWTK